MYDNCGHDHCNRLKSEITTMDPTVNGSDPARMELALWLWEVHNSVNARLMKEAAQRQNREISHEETLASKFPTKKQCPDCWLDANMTKWDNATVFHFLDEWYWPTHEPSDKQFKSAISGNVEEELLIESETIHDGGSSAEYVKKSTKTASLGIGFASLLCLVAFSLIVFAAVKKTRREKTKKFVDSRFEKKKEGFSCC